MKAEEKSNGEGSRFDLRSIIAATDLSRAGRTALSSGVALARRSCADLSVVSIIDPYGYQEILWAEEPLLANCMDFVQTDALVRVKQDLLRAGDGSTPIRLNVGDPAERISSFTEALDADLLVIGANRHSWFERYFGRSSGEQIIRQSACPVLIATQNGVRPFRRILVAVDLSPTTQPVLRVAKCLAQLDESAVRVIYSDKAPKARWRRLTRGGSSASRERERGRFLEIVQGAGFPRPWDAVIREDPAGTAILAEAWAWDADLIVMGTGRARFPFPNRLDRTSRGVLLHGNRSVVAVP